MIEIGLGHYLTLGAIIFSLGTLALKQILQLQTLIYNPLLKFLKILFTTFVLLRQLTKAIMVFFSTKTISHFGIKLCQLDAVLV